MASAKNMVLAGDFTGCRIFRPSANLAYISGTMKKMDDIPFTPQFVSRFEVLTEDTIRSGNSLLLTGSLDPAMLTNLKLHASEHMQNKGIYTIAVKFVNEKRVLIEVDDKIYTTIVRRMPAPAEIQ